MKPCPSMRYGQAHELPVDARRGHRRRQEVSEVDLLLLDDVVDGQQVAGQPVRDVPAAVDIDQIRRRTRSQRRQDAILQAVGDGDLDLHPEIGVGGLEAAHELLCACLAPVRRPPHDLLALPPRRTSDVHQGRQRRGLEERSTSPVHRIAPFVADARSSRGHEAPLHETRCALAGRQDSSELKILTGTPASQWALSSRWRRAPASNEGGRVSVASGPSARRGEKRP